jgi:hypothetical protein
MVGASGWRSFAVQSGASVGRVGGKTNPHAQTSVAEKRRRQFCTAAPEIWRGRNKLPARKCRENHHRGVVSHHGWKPLLTL